MVSHPINQYMETKHCELRLIEDSTWSDSINRKFLVAIGDDRVNRGDQLLVMK